MVAELTDKELGLLSEHPWDDTIPRLVHHASRKMKRLFWQGIFGGTAPGGKEAKDLVMEAIRKVFEGDRSWTPEDHPDIFLFLKAVIDSDISHLVEGWENRHLFREATLSGKDKREGERPGFLDTVSCPNPGPEVALLNKEMERFSEKFFWGFYEELDGSPNLQKMLECISEGFFKRTDISEKMGIPVKEFDNIKKQIQRRLKSFQEKETGGKK